MALVPYRVGGAAADQRADQRLLQLPGGITLRLAQRPGLGGGPGGVRSCDGGQPATPQAAAAKAVCASTADAAGGVGASGSPMEWRGPPLSSLSNVGLVVWQAGFLLADYLLRNPPFGGPRIDAASAWRPLTAVDLGTGSGVVGIALALAGARVFLTDLPHVLPLAEANVASNCDPRVCRTAVCAYRWGDDPAAGPLPGSQPQGEQQQGNAEAADGAPPLASVASPLAGVIPDLITAADVLYHPELLTPLMAAIKNLSAPHTLTFVSYRVRHGGEVAAFAALAEAAGFAVQEVPPAHLHEEYRHAAGGGGGVYAAAVMRQDASDSDGDAAESATLLTCSGGLEGNGRVGLERPPGSYGILRLCRRDAASFLAVAS